MIVRNHADDDTIEKLYELYVAECDRTKTRPTISDFSIWMEEEGYNDDLEDVMV